MELLVSNDKIRRTPTGGLACHISLFPSPFVIYDKIRTPTGVLLRRLWCSKNSLILLLKRLIGRTMACFTLLVELLTMLLLRYRCFVNVLYLYAFITTSVVMNVSLFRSLTIEAMMERLQTYGHVESYSLYCLQVTCLLMILIS